MDASNQAPSKKRRTTRASSGSPEGDDKRRGRPRVEKQDESAADVRLLPRSPVMESWDVWEAST
jgi:hypothetical protein